MIKNPNFSYVTRKRSRRLKIIRFISFLAIIVTLCIRALDKYYLPQETYQYGTSFSQELPMFNSEKTKVIRETSKLDCLEKEYNQPAISDNNSAPVPSVVPSPPISRERTSAEAPTTTEVPAPTPTVSAAIVDQPFFSVGAYGRLYIDMVGIDVELYYSSDLSKLQYYVDKINSACIFRWTDGNTMIADHCDQGFEAIKSCVPGMTARIISQDSTQVYVCKAIYSDCWNLGSSLTFNDYTPISKYYINNLIIYTCNANGTVTVTVWG